MRLFSHLKQQEGQSAIIIAGALIALIALLALVVDAGNAYAQRRQMQNAVDAGSQAGSVALGLNKKIGDNTTPDTINYAIRDYVNRNGVDPNRIQWYFVTEDSNGNKIVDTSPGTSYGNNVYAPKQINGRPVVGVNVVGDKQFSSFFAGVVGWRQLQVGALASSFTNKGACGASNLFPMAISENVFDDLSSPPDGVKDVIYEDTNATYTYPIVETAGAVKRLQFVTWNGNTSTSTLASNLNATDATTSPSGLWNVGEKLSPVSTTLAAMSGAMSRHIGQVRTIPVYDPVTSTNTQLVIKAFARIKIVSIDTSKGQMNAKFEHWVDSTGQGGCANYGVVNDTPGEPPTVTRNLVGTVKLRKLNLTNTYPSNVHVPVDVTNVVDISGSMNDPFGSQSKINAAKSALKSFNLNMQPSLGDKVSLVSFPRIPSGNSYSYTCQQSGSTTNYYFGEVRQTLTSNISGVNAIIDGLTANGGTPIADSMRLGLQTVLGAGHSPTSVPVIILATDGMTNIRLNGVWTGYQGSIYDNLPCNQPAVQDALDQANIAKSDNNGDNQPDSTIFTIAIGDQFNPAALQAMASVDTDPAKPHYFRVTDAAAMANIYQQIANRVQQIGNESCKVIETTQFAPGARLNIRLNETGQTFNLTTTSTGEFVMKDVQPGTYTVTSGTVTVEGLTYDVFTDGVGGPPLTSSPTITVGQGATTYKAELDLKTNTAVTCGN